MTAEQRIAEAIRQSVQQTEIVHLGRLTVEERGELSALAEDWIDGIIETEYWGTDADGSEWRVHGIRE